MFLLDSLLIGGIRWALDKALAVAEAEMNDDSALRDRLLEAEMQREMGEITDEEFVAIEADLLRAIREIKQRRDGGSGALGFGGAKPIEAGDDSSFQVEAELSGDFYGAEGPSNRSDTPEPVPPLRTTRTARTVRTTRTARTK